LLATDPYADLTEHSRGDSGAGLIMSLSWAYACGLILSAHKTACYVFAAATLIGLLSAKGLNMPGLILWATFSSMMAVASYLLWRAEHGLGLPPA
jgi:hypothetical protein